jgi:hypothetical protein
MTASTTGDDANASIPDGFAKLAPRDLRASRERGTPRYGMSIC